MNSIARQQYVKNIVGENGKLGGAVDSIKDDMLTIKQTQAIDEMFKKFWWHATREYRKRNVPMTYESLEKVVNRSALAQNLEMRDYVLELIKKRL